MPGFFRSRAIPEAADMSRICPERVVVGVDVWLSQGGSISGHVFRVDRRSGPVWFAKYRLPDGRQVQKRIAPAWTRPGGRRPASSTGAGLRRGWPTSSPRRTRGRCRDGADRDDLRRRRRRYKLALERAGLRSLRFHDLRHTFGTRAISKADILRVKEWMGHADVATTMRYLHYVPRPEDARLIAAAFEIAPPTVLAPSSMPDWSTQRGSGHRGEAA
jgi:Phage integrase family